jgi:cystathionine beta-lyase/cystathionine gamma-synthase
MQSILLNRVLNPPPEASGPASFGRTVPRHQPALELGVAQPFTTARARKDALAHVAPGHYYQRESHPTTVELAARVGAMLGAKSEAILFESGKAACVTTLKALTPSHGRVLCDNGIYYEVQRELLAQAAINGWEIQPVDFTDLAAVSRAASTGSRFDLFYLDNPRNWFLSTMDIAAIAKIAARTRTLTVVDVSVHPLQEPLARGADVAVCSLSKYPAAGFDMGGAVAANSDVALHGVKSLAAAEGHVLGNHTALAIWTQMVTLEDRFQALSEKALRIAHELSQHAAVKAVHMPNPSLLGGLVGGQLSFQVKDSSYGRLLERVVEFQALDPHASLHLMCTFGAAITSIEHFDSNPRYREGIAREATNEVMIPPDMLRLGIGHEPVKNIIDQLKYGLNMVLEYNAACASGSIRSKTA